MINITSIKNINNLSDYEIIIPSNYDLYYKELFVNENITFNTVRNFLINNYTIFLALIGLLRLDHIYVFSVQLLRLLIHLLLH